MKKISVFILMICFCTSALFAADALVVYFSVTGNTEEVAEAIADELDADVYRIVPEVPYTTADINYSSSTSRTSVERNDPDNRPAISGSRQDFSSYSDIYIGYPIWWGDLPRIMYTFFDTYDFSGKHLHLFSTSGSSSITRSVNTVRSLEPDAIIEGSLGIPSRNLRNIDRLVSEWLSH